MEAQAYNNAAAPSSSCFVYPSSPSRYYLLHYYSPVAYRIDFASEALILGRGKHNIPNEEQFMSRTQASVTFIPPSPGSPPSFLVSCLGLNGCLTLAGRRLDKGQQATMGLEDTLLLPIGKDKQIRVEFHCLDCPPSAAPSSSFASSSSLSLDFPSAAATPTQTEKDKEKDNQTGIDDFPDLPPLGESLTVSPGPAELISEFPCFDPPAPPAAPTASELWNTNIYPPNKRARLVAVANTNTHVPTHPSTFIGSQRSAAGDCAPAIGAGRSASNSSIRADVSSSQESFAEVGPSPSVSSSVDSLVFDYSLGFPCLSVGDYQFDPLIAIPLMMEGVEEFLVSHGHERLRLVLYEERPDILAIVDRIKQRGEFAYLFAPNSRFAIHRDPASFCSLSSSGLACRYLATASDWKFSATGARRKFHEAFARPGALTKLSQDRYGTAKPSVAYPIEVPVEPVGSAPGHYSALQLAGVRHVIHVLPPNLNPQRIDCLSSIEAAKQRLRAAYSSVFECFYRLTRLPPPLSVADADVRAAKNRPPPLEFPDLPGRSDEAAIREDSSQSDVAAPVSERSAVCFSSSTLVAPVYRPPASDAPALAAGHWATAFAPFVSHVYPPPPVDPLAPHIFWEDASFIAIYDRYPKSRVHALLLSKKQPLARVDGPAGLTAANIEQLTQMRSRADWLCECLERSARDAGDSSLTLRCGLHALPSLAPLHVHIISQDFDSPWLKHKKHWNSFTTPFFIPLSSALNSLHSSGAVPLARPGQRAAAESFIKAALRCHRVGCHTVIRDMKQLKIHIKQCTAPYPKDAHN